MTDFYPNDVRNSIYWSTIMRQVKGGIPIYKWQFITNRDLLGYWSDKWYYKNNLIYEEGHCEWGEYAIDYTINTKWLKKNDYSNYTEIIVNNPLYFT